MYILTSPGMLLVQHPHLCTWPPSSDVSAWHDFAIAATQEIAATKKNWKSNMLNISSAYLLAKF